MKDLRIVFMGTPDFAVATLQAIVEASYQVVGVITAPDKPAGRGRKLRQSAVKEYALSQGLNVMQPTNLKDETFNQELQALQPDLQIVVAFRMLPKVVWQLPKLGTFNLHASLLPDYRGAAPINWAVMNGETKTGVTTFFIDEKIDTGEMILQKEVAIDADENAGSLHDKLMQVGSDLVLETVAMIEKGEVTTIKQPEADGKTAYKIHRETCMVDWNESIDTIYNKVRGLSPYPAAWTTLHNGDEEVVMKIYKAEKIVTEHDHSIGALIIEQKHIDVAVKNGYLRLHILQIAGKKKMEASALLNGYKFEKGANLS